MEILDDNIQEFVEEDNDTSHTNPTLGDFRIIKETGNVSADFIYVVQRYRRVWIFWKDWKNEGEWDIPYNGIFPRFKLVSSSYISHLEAHIKNNSPKYESKTTEIIKTFKKQ